MNRIVISLLGLCIVTLASFVRSEEPETTSKKYHVYTVGCRRGASLQLSTNNIREASTAAAKMAELFVETKIVTGPHQLSDVIRGQPTQYEVFRIGIRCGNLFSLGTTRKQSEIAELTKNIAPAKNVVIVTYQ